MSQHVIFENMGNTIPLPDEIPVPNKQQSKELEKMGIRIERGDSETHTKGYVKCLLPVGWSWKNDTQYDYAQDWKLIDPNNQVRILVVGCWKGMYDNKLYLSVSKEPYQQYQIPFRFLVGDYARFVKKLGIYSEENEKLNDKNYATLLKEFESREMTGNPPKKIVLPESLESAKYENKLRDRLRQLEFATSYQGIQGGYARDIPSQLQLLQQLREKNSTQHDKIIESSDIYKKLYRDFPEWADPKNLTLTYQEMDHSIFSQILK